MLRIGVIGTGGMGRHHIGNIRSVIPGARVTAVNDANEAIAKQVAADCGARFIAEPRQLIRADDVDAVMIASWDPTHEEFSIAAIEAGKYVFCEKPLSDTPEGCLRIMEAEQKAGKRLLQVGFMRRYDQAYRELRAVIEKGTIGRPLVVRAQHRNLAPAGGATITSDMSATNALVHEFDITRYLIGGEDTYVSAQLVAPRSSRFCGDDLIDPQLVYLETKQGVRVELELFWYCHYGYDIRCEVVGDLGTASLPDPAHTVVRCDGQSAFQIVPTWQERFDEAYITELREWIASVQAENITGPSAWDGYIASLVASACRQSRLTGGIVPIRSVDCPDFYHVNF
ncbi:Gfo/Idh/MocA family oxidoreductase [Butyricicoccus faecihominis]|uniref:Gfo/Idh/MocA family protein n=1 Tax=Butyricicoccus faecihominis TaxID=1712515 RepID=UPI00247AF9DB|nr:Gfo/Idh/MocA family oxidoreductase [Butyricicoccus faecihominis]MCQ5128483.1 Gfo/Idh/MocA family oxidoreductase [Butyricicoccus faecihominis]